MRPVTVRGCLPLVLLVLTTASLTGCAANRPPSASGLCAAAVEHVVVFTDEEWAVTPPEMRERVLTLNAAVLAACGAEP